MKGKKTGGRTKGTPNKITQDAELRLAVLRELVSKELEPMTQAQIEHAKGVHYMVLRHKDGTFTRATDEKQINAAVASGALAFEIYTQAPNTQAFSDLLNRTFGKPAERVEMTGDGGGPVVHIFKWRK